MRRFIGLLLLFFPITGERACVFRHHETRHEVRTSRPMDYEVGYDFIVNDNPFVIYYVATYSIITFFVFYDWRATCFTLEIRRYL